MVQWLSLNQSVNGMETVVRITIFFKLTLISLKAFMQLTEASEMSSMETILRLAMERRLET